MRPRIPLVLAAAALLALPAAAQTLSGTVWEDSNANGLIDAGEAPLEGVTLRMMGQDRCWSGTETCGTFGCCICPIACNSGSPEDYGSLASNPAGGFGWGVTVHRTDGNGAWGSYLVDLVPPADYRITHPRIDNPGVPGNSAYKSGTLPHGNKGRWQELDVAYDRLLAASSADPFHYVSFGDSIAAGFNLACLFVDNDFVEDNGERLKFIADGHAVEDNRAVSGERTEDLLLDDPSGADENDLYYAVGVQPDLISISIVGNNYLDNQPGGLDVSIHEQDNSERNKACWSPGPCNGDTRSWEQLESDLLEVLQMSRQDLQEILSTLVSKTTADILMYSLYESEASRSTSTCLFGTLCDVSDLHKELAPVVNQVVRELTWGQERVVRIAETRPEYHHQPTVKIEDPPGTQHSVPCEGQEDVVCCGDHVHPDSEGARIHEQKTLEAAAVVTVGDTSMFNDPDDARDNPPGDDGKAGDYRHLVAQAGVSFGLIRRMAVVYPTTVTTSNGATVAGPDQMLADDGVAGSISINGWAAGSEGTVTLSGFELPPGILPEKVLVKVEYKTSSAPVDEFYRIEASTVGFAKPSLLDVSNFNWLTPIVGTHGQVGPLYATDDWPGPTPAVPVLAYPDYPGFRTVSASLFKGASTVCGNVAGHLGDDDYCAYDWDRLTAADLSNLEVRVQGALKSDLTPVAGESYTVDVDAVWIEIYGRALPEIGGPENTLVADNGDGTLDLSWDAVGAPCDGVDYAIYRGDLQSLHGSYTHETPVICSSSGATSATVPLPAGNAYFIVVSRDADAMGHFGFASGGGRPAPAPANYCADYWSPALPCN